MLFVQILKGLKDFTVKATIVVCVGIGAFFIRRRLRRHRHICECQKDMTGMVAIVTGASSGIGAVITEELARRGCSVVMACRDMQKATEVKNLLPHSAKLSVLPLDLSSPQSIEIFLSHLINMPEIHSIQILVNNAAVFDPPNQFNNYGVEMHFAVNHVGHFHLTMRLLELNFLSSGARVVTMASSLAAHSNLDFLNAYMDPFSSQLACLSAKSLYASSKLANCLFTREFHRRYPDNYVPLCVQTDGMAATGIFRHSIARAPVFVRPFLRLLAYLLFRSPYEAAQNAIHCCAANELFLRPGAMHSKCRPVSWFESAVQYHLAESLWDATEDIVKKYKSTSLSMAFRDDD